jgi:hypothetical protein
MGTKGFGYSGHYYLTIHMADLIHQDYPADELGIQQGPICDKKKHRYLLWGKMVIGDA